MQFELLCPYNVIKFNVVSHRRRFKEKKNTLGKYQNYNLRIYLYMHAHMSDEL